MSPFYQGEERPKHNLVDKSSKKQKREEKAMLIKLLSYGSTQKQFAKKINASISSEHASRTESNLLNAMRQIHDFSILINM